jgi:hypothetical protein
MSEEEKELSAEEIAFEREKEVALRKLLHDSWHARNKIYEELLGAPSYVSPASYSAPSPHVHESWQPGDVKELESTRKALENPALEYTNSFDGEGQHLAVLAYGPDPFRPFWTYVTAGMSSPWVQHEPDEVSGFGCELMIKSPTDNKWAPGILRTIAYYIFNHAGVLSPGARLALNAPIDPNSQSVLRNLMIWYADEAPDAWYQLPSGGFGLFTAIGISDAELKYAEKVEKYGTWCIEQLLRRKQYGQVTDPARSCTMQDSDTGLMLFSIVSFADTFRENEAQIASED